jgi:hypothetical protein
MWMFVVVLMVPLIATAWVAWSRRPDKRAWRSVYGPRIALLFAIGLAAAGPFLTSRALGTSEAYNYSLSTSDAVVQFREGVFPVLIGQSEFAFMGRVHPLRTAPYMAYFAILIDTLSFRQLSFWAIQNLTVALSLIGAAFSMYACLRRATQVPPNVALVITALYLLTPGVLSAVYAMDLYMTVMTVPFVPLVMAANVLALRHEWHPRFWLLLAIGLGAAWTAHPPMALWLSIATFVFHVFIVPMLAWKRAWRALFALTGATVLGIALAAFAFVSALTISPYRDIARSKDVGTLLEETAKTFSGSLRPVSATASTLSDFQLGYPLWIALILAVGGGLWILARRRTGRREAFTALCLAGLAVGFVVLLAPSPLQKALWEAMPTAIVTISNQWPMQRLYLMLAACSCFALALVCPRHGTLPALPKAGRDFLVLSLTALGVWTGLEAWKFVRRGYASRQDAVRSQRLHAPQNLNPTLISYSILGSPSSFVNGVMDPQMELRLLRKDSLQEHASNWDAPPRTTDVSRGTLRVRETAPNILVLGPALTLQPHTRYRLDFEFRVPPQEMMLQFVGPSMLRDYLLPAGGNARAFGMLPGNRPSLPLWTSLSQPEEVTLQLAASQIDARGLRVFADFTLSPLNIEALPLRIESFIPLRIRVRTEEPALLETVRLFTEGYEASINGERVPVFSSPDRLVMVSVPAGESLVEVRYPGPSGLRAAFWLSLCAWVGVALGGGATLIRPSVTQATERVLTRIIVGTGGFARRHKVSLLATAGFLVLSIYGVKLWQDRRQWLEQAGPVRLEVLLPREATGRSQPLVTTGRFEAGSFVFVIYKDSTHVQVGLDVWGRGLWYSEPIPVDYYRAQEFVISSGALYPESHPKLAAVSTEELAEQRKRVTVDLNGRRVLDVQTETFSSPVEQVTVGENRIGGSTTDHRFTGEILRVERLPVGP